VNFRFGLHRKFIAICIVFRRATLHFLKRFFMPFAALVLAAIPILYSSNSKASQLFPFPVEYRIGLDELLEYVIANSPAFDAHRSGIEAAQLAQTAAERYQLPKFNLAFEGKSLFGEPDPDPRNTVEAILNSNSRIWGSQANTTIAASRKETEFENLSFDKKRMDVYFEILGILAKIERVRFYQYEAGLLRREKVDLVERLANSVEAGISPVSELKEAELNLVRFDETILTSSSVKENLFNELSVLTGIQFLDQSQVGISLGRINGLIEMDWVFSEDEIVSDSLEIRVDVASLEQTRLQAESENERVRLSLISEIRSPVRNEPALSSGQIRNTSYVGARLDIQLYDYQARTSRQSSLARARRQSDELRDKQQRLTTEVQRLQTRFVALQDQRENAFVQLRIGRELLEARKLEVFLDRVSYLDLSKSVMLYLSGFQTLMDLDMQMYDLILGYLRIRGDEI
jgi:hypothetical protein